MRTVPSDGPDVGQRPAGQLLDLGDLPPGPFRGVGPDGRPEVPAPLEGGADGVAALVPSPFWHEIRHQGYLRRMADYERSVTVDAPADELFEYLSKVENLPAYMDRMTSVRNLPGDEVEVEARIEPGDAGTEGGPATGADDGERAVGGDAWFRIDADARTLSWGSEGPHDYHGELQVTGGGASSTVTVRLHTMHDAGGIEDGIEQTLANIQRLAGSDGELNAGAGTS